MNVINTTIPEVKILEPKVFGDDRGYFFESYSEAILKQYAIYDHFVQDNESKSKYGVLRGIHFQYPPYTQSKLVRVIKGTVFDIAVDLRFNSPTFKKYVMVELSEDNKRQLYIPRGFGHGFIVTSEEAIFTYKCDNIFNADSDGGIAFNDPDINIKWPNVANLILSDKDKNRKTLRDLNYLQDIFK